MVFLNYLHKMHEKRPLLWLYLIPIALLLIGLFNLPTGYYTLVRITVCLVSVLSCYWSYKTDKQIGIATVVFGLLAILFNPFIPVYLQNKGAWVVIDTLAAILLAFRFFTFKKQRAID